MIFVFFSKTPPLPFCVLLIRAQRNDKAKRGITEENKTMHVVAELELILWEGEKKKKKKKGGGGGNPTALKHLLNHKSI